MPFTGSSPGSGVLRAATVMTPTGPVSPGELRFEHGRITALEPAAGPVPDLVAVAGFVDLQVNGVEDVDCSRADGAAWARAGERLAATGVTAWLPTLVSQPLDRYPARLRSIAEAAADGGEGRPAVLGAHLEGPFLGARRGAHPEPHVVPLDVEWLDGLPDVVRLVTLGPEQERAGVAIARLAARGVLVSLGHSAADADTALAAVDAGARMVTHLFNAMEPMHHREPGLVGVALADDRLAVGLIADGVHVDPILFAPVFRSKGPARVALVTDAVAWRAGRSTEAGATVVDGAPRLPDGTIAGSVLTMDAAVRNVVDAGVPLPDALTAAATTPATLLGDLSRGRLAVGARADVTLLDAGSLSVRRTVVGGRTAWEA